ncbi:MAG: hypothetical protein K2J38_02885 [Muribaculaceae bacterium]|nr:hypothetical protein [Muribaculaceae bacterium]
MKNLHLFNPENDLALALDLVHYTPPPVVAQLRNSGATLPMWFGDKGDSFIARGVNNRWYMQMEDLFGMDVRPWDMNQDGMVPTPWGWSQHACTTFVDFGFDRSNLPSKEWIDGVRRFSHRSAAAEIARELSAKLDFATAPAATELHDIAQINNFIEAHPEGTVLKLPWSSSGRGIVVTDREASGGQISMFYGMISRQGSVLAEPRYKKVLDFAMLFNADESGGCTYTGLSVFNTVQFGSYAGNVLAPESELETMVTAHCGASQFDAVRSNLTAILGRAALRYRYKGPIGVDMMVVDSPDFVLAPVVEINVRHTMGLLCHHFYKRYAAAGTHGTFTVGKRTAAAAAASPAVSCGRMYGGTLEMAQPGNDFSFTVSLS